MILYADMVADLFHYGHVNFLKNIYLQKKEGDLVYIGIVSDESAKSYKRTPIMSMEERIQVVEACKYVDKVIKDSPVSITKEFIDLHKIDLIFTSDNRTEDEIKLMLEVPYQMGIVRKVPYTNTISTTDIIKRISKRIDEFNR